MLRRKLRILGSVTLALCLGSLALRESGTSGRPGIRRSDQARDTRVDRTAHFQLHRR